MTKKRPRQSDPTRVSFRLDTQIAEELARRAKEAGKSPGVHARELLLEALFEHQERRHQLSLLRSDMTRLATSLDTLRALPGDLAASVTVLLVYAGKLTTEQARQWVRQTLLHETQGDSQPCSPFD